MKELYRKILIAISLTTAITLHSCTPYQTQGALTGGLIGGATGAVVGNDSDSILKGAAIGAAGGAAVAAMNEEQNRRANPQNPNGTYQPSRTNSTYPSINQPPTQTHPTPPPISQPRAPQQYPVAERTDRPDVVISPFDPTREIGVKGFKSGDLVRDPKNNKVFRVP